MTIETTEQRIPTDHEALVAYLRDIPDRDRTRVADLLTAQYREEGHPDPLAMANDTFERALAEVEDGPDAAEPIPTDPYLLADYLNKRTAAEQVFIAERLAVQLGGHPDAIARACDLIELALLEAENNRATVRDVANLARDITGASKAIAAAQASLAALLGERSQPYHADYAETVQGLDLRAFLDDAARMLRAAAALNPCPPAKNGPGQ